MYIQNHTTGELPFTIPKGYRGNAFAPPPPQAVEETPPQAVEGTSRQAVEETPQSTAPPVGAAEALAPDTAPTPDTPPAPPTYGACEGAQAAPAFLPLGGEEKKEGGLFSKLPFLSSLLPPPRKKRGGHEGLPEWAVLGLLFLLLSEQNDSDLLPLLLLLLLWD